MFNLLKKVGNVFFVLVYFCLICNLIFRILTVGKIFVMNGIPTVLCLILVIRKIFSKYFIKSFFSLFALI